MKPRLTIERAAAFAALTVRAFAAILIAAPAFAHEAPSHEAASVPCAVLEEFDGEVEILDSSRSYFIDISRHVGIPCDSWISTRAGWAKIRHRDGYWLSVGSQTFAQIPENNTDGKKAGDAVILYKGEIYGRVHGTGAGTLRIATANARARIPEGAALVVFDQSKEETQLVVLERQATLENRFEGSRKMEVPAGEASSLNLKLERVLPSSPKAVAMASLKAKLLDLRIVEGERDRALEKAAARQTRKLASIPVPEDTHPEDLTDNGTASPELRTAAGAREPQPAPGNKTAVRRGYTRHTADQASAQAKAEWKRQMLGGERGAERLLGAEGREDAAASEPAIVPARGPASGREKKAGRPLSRAEQAEEREKERLIEEISRLRASD